MAYYHIINQLLAQGGRTVRQLSDTTGTVIVTVTGQVTHTATSHGPGYPAGSDSVEEKIEIPKSYKQDLALKDDN